MDTSKEETNQMLRAKTVAYMPEVRMTYRIRLIGAAPSLKQAP